MFVKKSGHLGVTQRNHKKTSYVIGISNDFNDFNLILVVFFNRKTSHPAGISSTDFFLPSFNGADTEVGTFCGQAFGAGNKEQLFREIVAAVVGRWSQWNNQGPRFGCKKGIC